MLKSQSILSPTHYMRCTVLCIICDCFTDVQFLRWKRHKKTLLICIISEPCIVLMDGSSSLMFCVSDCRGDTKLSIFEGDIRDADFLKKTCRGASTVFHIASIIDVNDSVEPSEIYGVNVKGKALIHWIFCWAATVFVHGYDWMTLINQLIYAHWHISLFPIQ